jgi:hypothetical protein
VSPQSAMSPETSVKPGYRSQSEDTSVESDAIQFHLLRQRTNAQRAEMSRKLTQWAMSTSLRGMRKASETTFSERFSKAILGEKWLPCLIPTTEPSMWIQDPSEIARLLHPIFEQLEIPYYITGGVAASMYGDPRTTRDMDVVVEIGRESLLELVNALEHAGFYCPPGSVEEIQQGRGRSLSVTHMETILNADLMLNADTAFDRSRMERRRLESIDEAGSLQVWICSPEDLILAKLLWRRGSQSEKQWLDVLGILKVQIENLDYPYLENWAGELGLAADLQRALTEAGIEGPQTI